jgi:hypothetical protein
MQAAFRDWPLTAAAAAGAFGPAGIGQKTPAKRSRSMGRFAPGLLSGSPERSSRFEGFDETEEMK